MTHFSDSEVITNVGKMHSSWFFLAESSRSLREWVAYWTGFDEDNIKVHVEP